MTAAAAFATAPRRVLVKEVNWLGDLVMTLPALRAVRRAFPKAELAVLVQQDLAAFFDGLSWVDRVLPYRIGGGLGGVADRARTIAAIRSGGFDLAILFPKSFEAALWTAAARVPRRAGFAVQGRGLLLTDRTLFTPDLVSRHQVHDYLVMLRGSLGLEGSADEFSLSPSPARRTKMEAWLATHRGGPAKPLLALAPAAAYGPAKEWPAERYTALIDRGAERGMECVLVGAPAERARCEGVARASRAGAIVAAGETDVGDLVALLSLCAGFAGNDSGAMHVAGALGIPTVGIFGSTDPARTGALGARVRILRQPIECSPCFDRTCRFGHYECLKRIPVDQVMTALAELGVWE